MALTPVRDSIGAALGWSRGEPVGWRSVAVGALGMVVPVAVGLALARPQVGFTIGLGAMLLAGGPSTPVTQKAGATQPGPRSPTSAVIPALLAVATATAITGEPWTDAIVIALAAVAATLSGYSRPLAISAIRFIIYLALSVVLLDNAGPHRSAAALMFGLGALWNIAVRMLLAGSGRPIKEEPRAPARTPTPAQRRAHWRRSLRTLAGWQFTIRLVMGLGVGAVIWRQWPGHHLGWIVLTVALLTQRPIEHLPVKTVQRTLGTLIGVALAWALLSATRSPALLGVAICLLAAVVPFARARSYLAYSALSTPVILLIMDLNKPPATSLLTDRLIATLAGAAIVIVLNLMLDRLVAQRAQTSA